MESRASGLRLNREWLRYLLAGGLAFAVDFGLLYFCKEHLGLHYLVANLISYGGGLALTYLLNTRWVFDYRKYKKKTLLELAIFNAIVLAGLALNQVLMLGFVEWMELHYLQAKIVASVAVTLFNYVAKKYILFHPTDAKPS